MVTGLRGALVQLNVALERGIVENIDDDAKNIALRLF